MTYENRKYLIIPNSEVSKVNFDEVLETSAETLRKSVDEAKTFIKWDGDNPSFVSNLTGTEGPYNHSEILDLLSGEEWNPPIEEI